MRKRLMPRLVLGTVMAASISLAAVGSAQAYGAANWQITFAGTAPGFGFWGWCDLGGGTTFNSSGLAVVGTSGDCQFAEYVHVPGVFSGTCEQSVDLKSEGGQPAWQAAPSGGGTDWFFSGTAVTHPSGQAAFCQTLPGAFAPTFSDFDSLLPVIPGHSSLNGALGLTELQITEQPAP